MKFATAVNCMDGRVQLPVIEHIRKKYGAEYVDMVTEPGVDRLLCEAPETTPEVGSVRRRLELSVASHGSELVAVIGHDDCAANHADPATHIRQIRSAKARIAAWYPAVRVIGIWVDGEWNAEEV